jgi:hypothetical protein
VTEVEALQCGDSREVRGAEVADLGIAEAQLLELRQLL